MTLRYVRKKNSNKDLDSRKVFYSNKVYLCLRILNSISFFFLSLNITFYFSDEIYVLLSNKQHLLEEDKYNCVCVLNCVYTQCLFVERVYLRIDNSDLIHM